MGQLLGADVGAPVVGAPVVGNVGTLLESERSKENVVWLQAGINHVRSWFGGTVYGYYYLANKFRGTLPARLGSRRARRRNRWLLTRQSSGSNRRQHGRTGGG